MMLLERAFQASKPSPETSVHGASGLDKKEKALIFRKMSTYVSPISINEPILNHPLGSKRKKLLEASLDLKDEGWA